MKLNVSIQSNSEYSTVIMVGKALLAQKFKNKSIKHCYSKLLINSHYEKLNCDINNIKCQGRTV